MSLLRSFLTHLRIALRHRSSRYASLLAGIAIPLIELARHHWLPWLWWRALILGLIVMIMIPLLSAWLTALLEETFDVDCKC